MFSSFFKNKTPPTVPTDDIPISTISAELLRRTTFPDPNAEQEYKEEEKKLISIKAHSCDGRFQYNPTDSAVCNKEIEALDKFQIEKIQKIRGIINDDSSFNKLLEYVDILKKKTDLKIKYPDRASLSKSKFEANLKEYNEHEVFDNMLKKIQYINKIYSSNANPKINNPSSATGAAPPVESPVVATGAAPSSTADPAVGPPVKTTDGIAPAGPAAESTGESSDGAPAGSGKSRRTRKSKKSRKRGKKSCSKSKKSRKGTSKRVNHKKKRSHK
jgi:hypothetical protein